MRFLDLALPISLVFSFQLRGVVITSPALALEEIDHPMRESEHKRLPRHFLDGFSGCRANYGNLPDKWIDAEGPNS